MNNQFLDVQSQSHKSHKSHISHKYIYILWNETLKHYEASKQNFSEMAFRRASGLGTCALRWLIGGSWAKYWRIEPHTIGLEIEVSNDGKSLENAKDFPKENPGGSPSAF
jgi:hypothetical protein